MSALTTNQIIAATRRKLLEETTDLVTDETVLMNINLAYDDLKFRTFTNDQIKTATVSLTNGVGNLPSDFGTLYGDAYRDSSHTEPFPEKTIADFRRFPTQNAVTIEGGQLKVSPTSVNSVQIKYYPSYAALSTVQNPELNSYLHELIIYGALSRIHEDLQDEVLSKFYDDKYEQKFVLKTNSLSNYEEESQRGGEMFNPIRIV
jgi:hypothetical protein